MQVVTQQIQEYINQHSTPVSARLARIAENTVATLNTFKMMSSHTQGQFLKFLVSLSQAKRVLEIGTYVGYSALAMAEGLCKEAELITCESSKEHAEIAQQYFDESPYANKIILKQGPALETISNLTGTFDFVFIDADKQNYLNYYDAVLPKLANNGVIIFDNTLWSGEVLSPTSKSGLVLHQLNQMLKEDARVEVVMLSIRDGLSLVKKK